MLHLFFQYCLLIFVVMLLVACSSNGDTENQVNLPSQIGSIETEAIREGVFIVRDETREALPVEEPVRLNVGETVAVNENGRVTLRLADLLTAELFQTGEVTLQELTGDERPVAVTIRQSGGMLLGDFNPNQLNGRRLTIQTRYATVTTAGTRFLLVREANVPLEWIVNLGSAEDELQVTAAEVPRGVPGNSARWVAPDGALGDRVEVDTRRLRAWFNNVQSGEAKLALSEVILSPANLIADTSSLTTLPRMGRPFELQANQQGTVKLTLDPVGIFGNPGYSLADCNGDGNQDIALQAGKLQFDFRPLLARALALDVTVINRDQPGNGALWALDPAGDELDRSLLEVGNNQSQTLSLRSEQQFYHTATLALSNGCFLGFSLTPPSATGAPSEPRVAATAQPADEVVNLLATPSQSRPDIDQMEALLVSAGDGIGSIQIDGEPDDWDALTAPSGLAWTRFDTVTYDTACSNRYPASDVAATDLSGQVRFAYDEGFLYVAFRVDDDGYVGYFGDDQYLFLGDSPQLSLDMDLLGDFNDSNRNQDDWQVDFQPDFESPRAALWQLGSLTSRPFDEALVAAAPTATGYFLETALPWESFGTSLQPGDRLGLAANVNDNDTPGSNVQECIISTAPQREWDAPTTWGTLLLRPAGR